MVVACLVILELNAKTPSGHGMFRIAAHTLEPSPLDIEEHRAGVGTVMWAGAE
jgi:hypothetical protein